MPELRATKLHPGAPGPHNRDLLPDGWVILMFTDSSADCTPIIALCSRDLVDWMARAPDRDRRWLEQCGWKAAAGSHLLMPAADGAVAAVLVGVHETDRLWSVAQLPAVLPAGDFRLEPPALWSPAEIQRALLGWALRHYRFDRYKPAEQRRARMRLDADQATAVETLRDVCFRIRDLVNTPASDLGPAELADVAGELAGRRDADFSVIDGDRLRQEFPAIHAVGQASVRAPRLIRVSWGDPADPPLALVGKGVIFDTGGLDIKPGSGMVLMKKDMGGAAHALGLAELIMRSGLKVHLRVYIPAVENAISGNAYRPSDIVTTRNGTTVEIGNTDAEGRVVLADALSLASEEGAERIIDFATLTGAARVALGEDLPPLYARNDQAARAIQDLAFEEEDPLWHMPLYRPYKPQIESAIADLSNSGQTNFGGSLTAALFLDHFVASEIDWFHLDIYAWNLKDRPGRPAGGEVQGLRAMWAWLKQQYA